MEIIFETKFLELVFHHLSLADYLSKNKLGGGGVGRVLEFVVLKLVNYFKVFMTTEKFVFFHKGNIVKNL